MFYSLIRFKTKINTLLFISTVKTIGLLAEVGPYAWLVNLHQRKRLITIEINCVASVLPEMESWFWKMWHWLCRSAKWEIKNRVTPWGKEISKISKFGHAKEYFLKPLSGSDWYCGLILSGTFTASVFSVISWSLTIGVTVERETNGKVVTSQGRHWSRVEVRVTRLVLFADSGMQHSEG